MHGRPMLGKHRMVTVATRIEPHEVDKLKVLAGECQLSVCAYLRDLIRMELGRADRSEKAAEVISGKCTSGDRLGDTPKLGVAV